MQLIEKLDLKQEENIYDDLWFSREYARCFVDLRKPIERPETIISIGKHLYNGSYYDTAVMTAGEFSVISAPSKSNKSFFKSHLCASFIGGNSNYFFSEIKGHRKGDKIIIDCDTEQSRYYSQRTFSRVERIVGSIYENYLPFKMRHLSPDERVAFIDKVIAKHKQEVKLVFIDGVADLIEDTNDLVMSNYISGKLLKWTDEYNIHVCVIIHNAHGSNKPTGHLGSSVVKKAETVFQLKPDEEKTGIVKVTHQYSRGVPFDDFYFRVNNDDALIYQCDEGGNIIALSIDKALMKKQPIPTATAEEAFGTITEKKDEIPF